MNSTKYQSRNSLNKRQTSNDQQLLHKNAHNQVQYSGINSIFV